MRTRAEQIAAIKEDQRFWRDLAAEVGPDRYAEPGPMGEWSFGDVAGHLLGWRNRTINRLDAFAKGQPDPPDPWPPFLAGDPSDDPVNAWIHAQHADTPPGQLVADYDASYDRLIDVLGEVPDARLTDPNAIPWLEGAALIDVDFGGHLHDEHVPSIRGWLDGAPAGG
jgi:Mycothiol maleylpyruvate isomerase N-terminal domain